MKIKSLIAISLLSASFSLFAAESSTSSTNIQTQSVIQAQKELNDYEKIMIEKVWVTTDAIDEKGNKTNADNAQVSNYFGLAEYYPNGTFIMFTPEGKQKMQGDWSISDDGKIRTLVAKDTEGKTLFTRDVENITIKNDEYTYRIYPNADDRNTYFDIIHHVKK
ncbi:DUF4822 domain-containing protein [Proteus terrae]|uniref:DUF4822 domain-containing protein n=1 Tax=Proteus terrae subsp. cibarius TaxID=626774 RepID=A0A6G6S760_9GAMM|nr:DUF4822 domain-containing protein [Proteus terrae]QHP76752.1 DUF4822 domain-containing protein [Proteus vulgaris]MBG2913516.1 DUF4822 domain-containing protein [Proteus terrae subsp. cibarius]MBG3090886.1 DUF4822 domain-containing protein [Proteus terrae subsp. cibarius]MCO4182806.1 DUF4822 domain-containing protein [Proteus terrae]MCO4191105.1 DUF4822 domain-containing protein [Proteus terrae]